MSHIHSVLLETYFFEYIDRDIPLRATPLMTGVFEEEPLSEHIAARFGLSPQEAEAAIDIARQEVELSLTSTNKQGIETPIRGFADRESQQGSRPNHRHPRPHKRGMRL